MGILLQQVRHLDSIQVARTPSNSAMPPRYRGVECLLLYPAPHDSHTCSDPQGHYPSNIPMSRYPLLAPLKSPDMRFGRAANLFDLPPTAQWQADSPTRSKSDPSLTARLWESG